MNEQHRRKFKLLVALHALLEEQSVTLAAERMNLSVPSMSRLLAEIRYQFDDPMFVRVGHSLIPTPKAEAIKAPLKDIIEKSVVLFEDNDIVDIKNIEKEFVICANDLFFCTYAIKLKNILLKEAPLLTLSFVPEDNAPLDFTTERKKIDLYIGATDEHKDDTKTQRLFERHFIGIADRSSALFQQNITPYSFACQTHMVVSRKLIREGPIDHKLAELGLNRNIKIIASSYSSAILTLPGSDMILTAPKGMIMPSVIQSLGLRTFEIPLLLPSIQIKQSWNLCNDNDFSHRWLRTTIKEMCLTI